MNNHKSRAWGVIAGMIYVITVLCSMTALYMMMQLDMIPLKYLGAVILVVVFLLVLIFLLCFVFSDKKKKSTRYAFRMLGVTLALTITLFGGIGISMMNQLQNTIASMTGKVTLSEVVGVYVKAGDSAKELKDARNYVFGYTNSYDAFNTQMAISRINGELDSVIEMKKYDSVFTMVDGLLNDEVDAMILNTAYMSIMEAQEGYMDVPENLKLLYEYHIEKEVEKDSETEEESNVFSITEDPFIVYISGTDTRGSGLTNVRSDVNILAVVNPSSKQVLLINTPRDYYIPNPASEDGDMDKLTHCGIYGIDCSVEAMENLYETRIRYYAQVNFKGFTRLIDAIGGVTVYSEKGFYTHASGYWIDKGKNTLSGEVALDYVRDRYSFSDGDNARGRHQMDVIKAIIDKLSSGTILTNYADILESVDGYFALSLNDAEISALVKMQLEDLASWDVKTYSVTGEGKSRKTYSIPDLESYVSIPDEPSVERAKELIDMIYDGEEITDEDLLLEQ